MVDTGRALRPGDHAISEAEWSRLVRYAERSGTGAMTVGHRSIRLGHHVGLLQLPGLRLEILPKLGLHTEQDGRALLVHMLREVLDLRITAHAAAPLHSRTGSLYDVLVDRFLTVTGQLLREGLTRAYREVEGNERCLRGRLVVDRHLRENVVHRERLYVAWSTLDADTLLHRILHRALEQVRGSARRSSQLASAAALLADFPEVSPAPVRPADFDRIRLDRGTLR